MARIALSGSFGSFLLRAVWNLGPALGREVKRE